MQMIKLLVALLALTHVGIMPAHGAEEETADVEARSGQPRERPIVWPLGEELPEGLDQLAPAELREAMRRYRESGEAAVIRQSDAVVYPFNESQATVREIADALSVGTVLEGSVRRAGERLRVVVKLIDALADTRSGPKPTIASWPTCSRSNQRSPWPWWNRSERPSIPVTKRESGRCPRGAPTPTISTS